MPRHMPCHIPESNGSRSDRNRSSFPPVHHMARSSHTPPHEKVRDATCEMTLPISLHDDFPTSECTPVKAYGKRACSAWGTTTFSVTRTMKKGINPLASHMTRSRYVQKTPRCKGIHRSKNDEHLPLSSKIHHAHLSNRSSRNEHDASRI